MPFYLHCTYFRASNITLLILKLRGAWDLNVGRVAQPVLETGYKLDGLGVESRWGRDLSHQSRPALGPTQPPVQ